MVKIKKFPWHQISFALAVLFSVLFLYFSLKPNASAGVRRLSGLCRALLLSELVLETKLPDDDSRIAQGEKAILYVLGGSQKSLVYKFKKAAIIYKKGLAGKILVLSDPGLTEYDPALRRNLRNDEWAMKVLEQQNIPKERVDFVSLPEGIFGSLREGKRISELAIVRGYGKLILVTSDHHTRRVSLVFGQFLEHRIHELYVYGAAEEVGLKELIREYFKLLLYDHVLLPACHLWPTLPYAIHSPI